MISAIFIASILLIGALIPTTLSLFPGQLLNQVLADMVTGTDGDDNLEGSEMMMILRERAGMTR